MDVKSPITGIPAKLIKTYKSILLIEGYNNDYDIDVSNYFKGLEKLYKYKCPATGYQFFYPFEVAGDGFFYEKLQKFDWYYLPSKWEHIFAMKYIRENNSILEIGCGTGNYLMSLKKRFGKLNLTGIDVNEKAVVETKQKGINAVNSTIENHAKVYKNEYDTICAFQILEHIDNVNSFMVSAISALKQNGRLIFSVPNNNSFIKHNEGGILNFPPHHMGLWKPKVFKNTAKYYGLNVVKIIREPLQKVHFEYYLQVHEQRLKQVKLLNKIYHKIRLRKLFRFYVLLFNKFITGHNLLVVLEKK